MAQTPLPRLLLCRIYQINRTKWLQNKLTMWLLNKLTARLPSEATLAYQSALRVTTEVRTEGKACFRGSDPLASQVVEDLGYELSASGLTLSKARFSLMLPVSEWTLRPLGNQPVPCRVTRCGSGTKATPFTPFPC
jgi:hypothetical protein